MRRMATPQAGVHAMVGDVPGDTDTATGPVHGAVGRAGSSEQPPRTRAAPKVMAVGIPVLNKVNNLGARSSITPEFSCKRTV